MLKQLRRRLLRHKTQGLIGADLERRRPDFDPEFAPLFDACRSATMTSVERLYALYKAVEYIIGAGIEGDFVECGVWRGGSLMMMALALQHFGQEGRRLHAFDTFSGMPPPSSRDVRHETGETAAALLARSPRDEGTAIWALAAIDTVRANMEATGYPPELISFHVGMVESTLPAEAPERVALLRLDTDWYESTKHELVHLYPRLAPGGVLIIDDYGYFRGARQATDEFFAEHGALLLNRIDESGRIAVKPG
ncbi:MAG TPA: TylF/MycF/NovP-related O-methyltransferase [Stellaceae bacterium]|nr:TylF/MycF/NovP-related O-methyltransferase [Stellaceae bacterium]